MPRHSDDLGHPSQSDSPDRSGPGADARARYRAYRKAEEALMLRVSKLELSRDVLNRAAKALDMLAQGVFVFEGGPDMAVLFDFALHDVRTRGKTAVEHFRDTVGPANPLEAEILSAHAAATTSLFQVIATSPADDTLTLEDLLREGEDVRLTDVQLSRSAVPEMLLFLRPVVLDSLTITSGMMLAFPGSVVLELLADYRRRSQQTASTQDPRRRFLYFLKRYRALGLEVRLQYE